MDEQSTRRCIPYSRHVSLLRSVPLTMNQQRKNGAKSRPDKLSKKVADRTISNQRVAKVSNNFAKATRKPSGSPGKGSVNLSARHLLTDQEVLHHEAVKRGARTGFALLNENIEPTEVKQHFTTSYSFLANAVAGKSKQISLMSTVGQSASSSLPGETPKAFGSMYLTGIGDAVTNALPGPCARSDAAQVSACVVETTSDYGKLCLATTSADGGFALAKTAVTECPFEYSAVTGAHALRWQPICARIRVENVTIGSNRGGLGYVIQPTNAISGTTIDHSALMNKGIYRVFSDGEIREDSNVDGWVTLEPRVGLCAFSGMVNSATSASLGEALGFIVLESPGGGATQQFSIFLEIDWQLGGTAIRGIGLPHVVPGASQDRAREANQLMRTANILPSDQKGQESIPAALALHSSPALQQGISRVPHPRSGQHPVLSHIRKFLGKHVKTLAQAGLDGAIGAAAKVGAAFAA